MALSVQLAKVSFAAGEVSPELRVRSDLAKNQTGCWFLENMVVLLEGGVTRRPGTRMIVPYRDSTQAAAFIPFRFAGFGSNAYLIVINGGVARFILGNAVVQIGGGNTNPYEVAVPYTDADLGGTTSATPGVSNLRYTASGNVVNLFCDGRAPQTLTRNADNAWVLAPYLTPPPPVQGNGCIAPVDIENLTATTITITDPGGGTLGETTAIPGQSVKLVASAPVFDPANVTGVWRFDESTFAGPIAEWTPDEIISGVGALRRFNGNVYEATSLGTSGDIGPNAPVHTEGSVLMIQSGVTLKYLARDRGFAQITAVTDSTHATGLVLETIPVSIWLSPATANWWPSAWDALKGWPSRVALFGNSLVASRQGKLWKTQPGTFNNWDIADPTSAQSGLAAQLLSPRGSLVWIEWFFQDAFLAAGARDDEWMLAGQDPFSPITVANLNPYPSTHEGSATHIPDFADEGVIFIGRSRTRLHLGMIEFGGVMPRTKNEELTLSARHILLPKALGVSRQRDPNRLNWIWCADGSLVGNTLMVDQQINGWHRHPLTNGAVEQIATIPSNDEGVSWTYLGVRRVINGQTVKFVELLQPFFTPQNPAAPDASGAWFVDCGLQYTGPPVKTITGLDHLNGQRVGVHADGCMYLAPDGTQPIVGPVTGGIGIVMTRPTQNAIIGLPINYRVRLLPLDLETPRGTTAGARQKANHLFVRLTNSAGGNACVNPDEGGVPEPLTESTLLTFGVPVPLFTGVFRTPGLEVPLADEMIVEITGNDTMPFTLIGVDPDIEITESD
jgi:hypothetical protein